ncbi:hypothetical protein [uncultured Roseivirga sp.]|uniref:hypothetical protein n=1 Tax=uncultured Roseivirga sp. TaxID=543088 RepID=UPI000D79C34F|nr:hypothetical protein [uncultured Roseivirga sp.]PWL30629.1 MAG: hypothetical protein DCO95_03910 [Roseivirga sp. XM-24bin3]
MKNSVKRLINLFVAAALILVVSACEDDEPTPAAPTVSEPSSTDVRIGESSTFNFNVEVPGGFESSTVTQTGGTAQITSNLSSGDVEGTITVEFTAGSSTGAGSVKLTVNDTNGNTTSSTVVFSVTAPDAPQVTPPAAATVTEKTTNSMTFAVSTPGGYTSVAATATGGNVTVTSEPDAGSTSGDVVVDFEATTPGSGSVTVTVTDAANQSASATANLTIEEEVVPTVIVSENIDGTVTWETGTVYQLAGRITVLDGGVLNIEKGVIVKGQPGTGANATALLVARGGTLNAAGEADMPIIFTSSADEISPSDVAAGNFASPNLAPDVSGLWGGVIVLGKAKISTQNDNDQDISEVQIEGIPTSDPNGLYGGNEDGDNSGTINYISIRHGGSNIGSGNEINGLTLGGVGSGTTISNVEVVANQDDGIEFFGGTVSVTNAVIWNGNDDGLDTDMAWNGTVDNFVIIAPNTAGAHCFELDGPEGTYENGNHTLKNGTVVASVGDRGAEDLINTDANSNVNLTNIFITGIKAGQDINRTDAANVVFTGIELDIPAGAALADFVSGTIPTGVTAASTPSTGVGADLSAFAWTWASTSAEWPGN